MVYLATADEQPVQSSPDLRVEAIEPTADVVHRWFSLPAVRFIGAHTGCSCGFRHVGPNEEPVDYFEGMFDDTGEDAQKDLRSTRSLLALVAAHVAAAGEVQLYPVWNGEEHLKPRGTIELRLDTLDPRTFFFNERFVYRITAD